MGRLLCGPPAGTMDSTKQLPIETVDVDFFTFKGVNKAYVSHVVTPDLFIVQFYYNGSPFKYYLRCTDVTYPDGVGNEEYRQCVAAAYEYAKSLLDQRTHTVRLFKWGGSRNSVPIISGDFLITQPKSSIESETYSSHMSRVGYSTNIATRSSLSASYWIARYRAKNLV